MSPAQRPSTVPGPKRAVTPAPAPAEPVSPVAGAPQRPRPEKPFRFTLDLDRAHHQFLKDYALRAETGASKVMRALLDELRDDPGLAGRVRDRIWRAPDRRPLVPQNAEERYPRG